MTEVLSDQAVSRGDIVREVAELRRRAQRLETARRSEATSIGAGGVRLHAGGSVRVQGGGGVDVEDGGSIQARYADGRVGVQYGSLRFGASGDPAGHGLLVEDDADEDNNIFRARKDETGAKVVEVGSSSSFPNFFATTNLAQILTEQHVLSLNGQPGVAALGYADSSRIFLVQSDGLFVITPDTTASSANVFMSEFGFIARVTSAAAAKVDVEDLEVDSGEVLALRPRTWRDRGEVERDPDTDRWHVGLVAEEVEAAGLEEFVDYDEAGSPQAVAYDRLAIALLTVVQDQQRRLDALDGGRPGKRQRKRKPKRRPGLSSPTPQRASARSAPA